MNWRSPLRRIRLTASERIRVFPITDRTRRVGSIHLAMAGVITIAVGIAILTSEVSGRLTPFLLQVAPYFVSEAALLSLGGYLSGLTALLVTVSVLYVVTGALQIGIARYWYHGSHQASAVKAAIAGFMNPLSVPLAAIALAMILLWRGANPQSTTGNNS